MSNTTNTANAEKHYLAKKKFFNFINSQNHTLTSDYENARDPVGIKCCKGHEFVMTPSMFMVRGCPQCGKIERKQLKLQNFINTAIEKGYTFSRPSTMNDVVELTCKRGHTFKSTGNKFLKRNFTCPLCVNKDPRISEKRFKEAAKEKGWKILGKYENNDTHVKLRCDQGHILYMTPHNVKKDRGCSRCSGTHPEDARIRFKEFCEENGYKLLRYSSGSKNCTLRRSDGTIWNTITPDAFRNKIKNGII